MAAVASSPVATNDEPTNMGKRTALVVLVQEEVEDVASSAKPKKGEEEEARGIK